MSKVITFSRQFPGYHPRKGEPTYFVEKILNQLYKGRYDLSWRKDNYIQILYKLNEEKIKSGKLTHAKILDFYRSLNKDIRDCKPHTIRANNSRKQGQFFHPVVWSGRPYFDPQIIFAPPMEIKKLWEFEIKVNPGISEVFYLNGTLVSESNNYMQQWFNAGLIKEIAKNDGLDLSDFLDWFQFPKPFDGQIIAWDENVNY